MDEDKKKEILERLESEKLIDKNDSINLRKPLHVRINNDIILIDEKINDLYIKKLLLNNKIISQTS